MAYSKINKKIVEAQVSPIFFDSSSNRSKFDDGD
jgi:hypothetical protein